MIRSPTHPYRLSSSRGDGCAGELDVGYGVAGRATAEYPHFGSVGSESVAYASTVDAHGRLVIAGHSFDAVGSLVASLVRFGSNGTPDQEFGLRGFVTLPACDTHGEVWLRRMEMLPDGCLLVGFDVRGALRRQVLLLRLLPCGATDLGFMLPTDGMLRLAPGSVIDTLHGLLMRDDGSVLVLAGTHRDRVQHAQVALACLREDGRPAAGYGDDALASGVALVPLPAGLHQRQQWHLAALPDGGVLCAGDVCDGDGLQPAGVALCRLDPAGRAVPAFGRDGLLHLRHPDDDTLRSLAVRPDGRIVLTLQTGGEGAVSLPKVLQLLPDGRPDPAFGRAGAVIAHFGGTARYQRPQIARLQADGALLLAGNPWNEGDGQRVQLARLRPDGGLDPHFGEAGLLRCSFGHATGRELGPSVDSICGVHVHRDRILVAGHQLEFQARYKVCGLAVHA